MNVKIPKFSIWDSESNRWMSNDGYDCFINENGDVHIKCQISGDERVNPKRAVVVWENSAVYGAYIAIKMIKNVTDQEAFKEAQEIVKAYGIQ